MPWAATSFDSDFTRPNKLVRTALDEIKLSTGCFTVIEVTVRIRPQPFFFMAGKTCLMITHDLPSIADADLVLVLEAGQIVERGKHRDLVATSSRYRQLYELNVQHRDVNVPT